MKRFKNKPKKYEGARIKVGNKYYIWMKAYTRKDGTRVRGHYILDRGKAGKGPKLIELKGHLGIRKDYKDDKNMRIIKSMVGKLKKQGYKYPYATVMRRVNALYVLNMNTNKSWARRLQKYKKELREWWKSKGW